MTKLDFDRHRRLRQSATMRRMVRETQLSQDDFIYPMFVKETGSEITEISSMPGVFQWPLHNVLEEVKEVVELGIPSIILFGLPAEKDAVGSSAFHDHGIVQEATRVIKEAYPDLTVIADTCLCQFTDHGHCGVIQDNDIVNDASLDILAQTAVSQAKAGADIIAPSNMMDGFVTAIRHGLDEAGFEHIPIMAYSVKYASAFYGPFRDAAHGAPSFGDRKTYQMDPANREEALREAQSDLNEGADFLIVKPALSYLDIIREVKDYSGVPLVAYNVSGEYAMVKAAALNGWINEREAVLEKLISMKRAGADLILTYHAKDAVKWMNEATRKGAE
ncbi:porphobilinogen synthase [Alkalicoccobacillus porphyridii]|uniref:Delta-aminolevulinic acid dehydratase n=1 Tax=Alkalicoccobacillus porphyridii TaxID=2597270 RepID=A0A553ZXS9_9BACI|nr:porphobilinogen synthase [Alkalicoccobacillus porphyridii]TSB46258.1 porphobilinogen synthase [Alkalicoccobacillus porphyridii]